MAERALHPRHACGVHRGRVFVAHARAGDWGASTRKVTVKTCTADEVLGYYRKQWNARRFVLAPHGSFELYLSTTKRDCHKRPGEVIHTVERQGVPLLYVLRRR